MSDVVITIIFLIFAMVMFFWENIPVALTAMIVCVGFVLTGILEAEEAFAGFTDSSVLLYREQLKK